MSVILRIPILTFAGFLAYSYVQLQLGRRRRSTVSMEGFASATALGVLALEPGILNRHGWRRGYDLPEIVSIGKCEDFEKITFVFRYLPYSDWGGNSHMKGMMFVTLYRSPRSQPLPLADYVKELFPKRDYPLRQFVDYRTSSRWNVLLESEERPWRGMVDQFVKTLVIDEGKFPAVAAPAIEIPGPKPEPVAPEPVEPKESAVDEDDDLPPPVREQLPYQGRWALVRTGRWIEIRMGPGGCERQDVFFGTYQFVDRADNVLTFDRAEEFENGRARVELAGKSGYIDEQGNWI